jgi:hypothetical protein
MPRRRYNAAEVNTLSTFSPVPNFNVRSLTFVNNLEGLKIEDAITITDKGELVFKDADTEATLSELIEGSNGLLEETTDSGDTTLYFVDDKNNKISLGRVYELLFKENVVNGIFWFGERSSRFLNDEMDEYILEEFYAKADEGNVDPRALSILFEETDDFKNIWFDVPCIEVITPDYVDGKYASITAKVSFKMKCELSTITAFRIYDATTGLELSRTVQVIRGTPDEYVSYTVPLAYQGPLPDSIAENEGVCREVTINDLQNVEFVNGEEKGTAITKGFNGYYRIPNTRHIIKLQWATCSSTIELDTIGLPVGEFKRQFDARGETSLDVVVYDKNDTFNADRFRQFSGSFPIDSGKESHTINFADDGISIDEKYEYSVKLATNQNFETWVVSKTNDDLTIGWNKTPIRGEIDWIIVQDNKASGQQLATLNDENRALNHFLFGSKIVDADFCGEYIVPPPEIDFFLGDNVFDIPQEDCECCDCCSDVSIDDIDVEFIVWGGDEERPDSEENCDCPYYSAQDSNGDVRYSTNPTDFKYEVIIEESVGSNTDDDDDALDDDFDEDDFDDLDGEGFGDDDDGDDGDDGDDAAQGNFIDSARCLANIIGGPSDRGKITVDINQQTEPGKLPSYFLSLAEAGVSLESETYTNAEGGLSSRSQKYTCTLITIDSESDVWVESITADGCLIVWDPASPPKYGILYYNIRKTVFVAPNESVSVAIEPKRDACLGDPGIVNTIGSGNLPVAIFDTDDEQGEVLDNEPEYNDPPLADNGEVIFSQINNWSEE